MIRRNVDKANRDAVRLWHAIERGERGRICSVEWSRLKLNSYDRQLLLPYVTDDVLNEWSLRAIKNSRPLSRYGMPPVTYDEACIYALLPEALRRIRLLNERIKQLEADLLEVAS